MRIIGIDPGTYRTGYGIIDAEGSSYTMVDCGCLESRAQHTSERYFTIYKHLVEVVQRYSPDCCSIESTFYAHNPKVVMRLGEVRGVLILSAVQAGCEVFEYTPLQVKKSVVGYGKAQKDQVHKMVKALLSVQKLPKANDVSDALALALCHAHNRKSILNHLIKGASV